MEGRSYGELIWGRKVQGALAIEKGVRERENQSTGDCRRKTLPQNY